MNGDGNREKNGRNGRNHIGKPVVLSGSLRLVQTTHSVRERKWALCGEPEYVGLPPDVAQLRPIAWLYEMDFSKLIEDYNTQVPDERDRYRKDELGKYRRRGQK